MLDNLVIVSVYGALCLEDTALLDHSPCSEKPHVLVMEKLRAREKSSLIQPRSRDTILGEQSKADFCWESQERVHRGSGI